LTSRLSASATAPGPNRMSDRRRAWSIVIVAPSWAFPICIPSTFIPTVPRIAVHV